MTERDAGRAEAVDAELLKAWALPAIGSDKESRGRVLVIGGTPHTPGAVLLSGEAALRAGAGKLQIGTAPETSVALAVQVPEAGVAAIPHAALTAQVGPVDEALSGVGSASVVLVGPGVSAVEAAVELVSDVLQRLDDEAALVVDALGTAFLTEHPDGLGSAAPRTVVTMNPTELSRVLGTTEGELGDLGEATREAVRRTGAVVLCGAEVKHVAAPDGRSWCIDRGGPGLGVSGSGDVQSGIVAGMLARGCDPAQAAVYRDRKSVV